MNHESQCTKRGQVMKVSSDLLTGNDNECRWKYLYAPRTFLAPDSRHFPSAYVWGSSDPLSLDASSIVLATEFLGAYVMAHCLRNLLESSQYPQVYHSGSGPLLSVPAVKQTLFPSYGFHFEFSCFSHYRCLCLRFLRKDKAAKAKKQYWRKKAYLPMQFISWFISSIWLTCKTRRHSGPRWIGWGKMY